jgi:hypothetical protein
MVTAKNTGDLNFKTFLFYFLFHLEESQVQTSSNLICHQFSPLIRMSSYTEEHFKNNYNFSTNDEQSKWRSNTLKYHIESLLQ